MATHTHSRAFKKLSASSSKSERWGFGSSDGAGKYSGGGGGGNSSPNYSDSENPARRANGSRSLPGWPKHSDKALAKAKKYRDTGVMSNAVLVEKLLAGILDRDRTTPQGKKVSKLVLRELEHQAKLSEARAEILNTKKPTDPEHTPTHTPTHPSQGAAAGETTAGETTPENNNSDTDDAGHDESDTEAGDASNPGDGSEDNAESEQGGSADEGGGTEVGERGKVSEMSEGGGEKKAVKIMDAVEKLDDPAAIRIALKQQRLARESYVPDEKQMLFVRKDLAELSRTVMVRNVHISACQNPEDFEDLCNALEITSSSIASHRFRSIPVLPQFQKIPKIAIQRKKFSPNHDAFTVYFVMKDEAAVEKLRAKNTVVIWKEKRLFCSTNITSSKVCIENFKRMRQLGLLDNSDNEEDDGGEDDGGEDGGGEDGGGEKQRGELRQLTDKKTVLFDRLRSVFVGRLPKAWTEDHLFECFANFGTITNARVLRDKASCESKKFGYVEFDNKRCALAAAKAWKHLEIRPGHSLRVEECMKTTQIEKYRKDKKYAAKMKDLETKKRKMLYHLVKTMTPNGKKKLKRKIIEGVLPI